MTTKQLLNFINGQWQRSSADEYLDVTNLEKISPFSLTIAIAI